MRELFRKIAYIFDILPTKSRMGLVVIGCFVAIFSIIITLARYTILDHDFYKALADSQQLREVELAVNRGTIYATLDPLRANQEEGDKSTILATTSVTQDLSIDPSGKCNRDMLQNFLTDIVYQHLCLNRSQLS